MNRQATDRSDAHQTNRSHTRAQRDINDKKDIHAQATPNKPKDSTTLAYLNNKQDSHRKHQPQAGSPEIR